MAFHGGKRAGAGRRSEVPLDLAKAQALRKAGKSYAEIADILGVRSRRVKYHLDPTTRERMLTVNLNSYNKIKASTKRRVPARMINSVFSLATPTA